MFWTGHNVIVLITAEFYNPVDTHRIFDDLITRPMATHRVTHPIQDRPNIYLDLNR